MPPRREVPVRVFVSSTYKDLVAHRTAVREVLHRMKADVEAMEYFGSRPDTPEHACEKEVNDCDVFIGIYAWRYGWQPEADGPSITEQEFDCARQAGKQCLCYVVAEHPWPPGFIDTGDARDRLDRFKARVGTLVVSTFTTPDDLAKHVAADLSRVLRELTSAPQVDTRALAGVPDEVLAAVKAALGRLAEPATTSAPDVHRSRYVVRQERFGSLVFDRTHVDYIAFDRNATDIFRLVGKRSLTEVYELFQDSVQRTDVQRFVSLCQSIQLLDAEGRFTGVFIDTPSPPDHCLSAPLIVHLACTHGCNLRCDHCHADAGRPHAGELTTQEVHRIVDQLADMGCWRLSLGGGEPLVRADLPDIVRKANNRGVSVRLATNGTAATPSVVESLRGLAFEAVKVSMEGTTDDAYDTARGVSGAFQAALAGIAHLRTLGMPIELHQVVMRSNVGELQALIALAERLEVQKLVLDIIAPVGRAVSRPDLLLSDDEIRRLWDDVDALRSRTSLPIDLPHRPPFQVKHLLRQAGCECGQVTCHIDPLGNVRPTGLAPMTTSAGNVRERSLRAIWQTSGAFAAFRAPCADSRCLVRQAAPA
jgi:MoaA/NifB/PqqE/SkfB family radical SAM enzyme